MPDLDECFIKNLQQLIHIHKNVLQFTHKVRKIAPRS